ncbi:cation-translocating P-type ATPase [Lacticaseibacillus brantae]|uniref:E1-E2 family cation-transporting ATPase n=1 Tax=Lacticaseibacillus brantae DSM 23927 TaxID=1423727 RepID=A0A0R2AWJ2_9LACO|nr:cation-transporting P-type ATPase [Lacticaseibacillus brantae]KRM71825.1 E1-E2 family cation-transporting ATPase [Lacticaseibacillus brantae DSM 23927]
MTTPYRTPKKVVLSELQTNRQTGLSANEAASRLEQHGPNQLHRTEQTPAWKTLLKTFTEPLVIILFIAAGLALLNAGYDFFSTGNAEHGRAAIYEAVAILVLIFLNAGIAFFQARSTQKSLAALENMTERTANVMRDGDWEEIAAADLVPGDIICVNTGDFIEADVRFLSVSELQVNEAHLTGEAEPIDKQTHALDEDLPIGDRTNMGFSGSMVTHGNAIAVVTGTGMDTELGHIATLLDNVDDQRTPIERAVAKLTKVLMRIAIGLVFFTLAVELIKTYVENGGVSFDAFINSLSPSIAIAVAAIPDALPVVLSIVLTIGAATLAKNRGLVKSLNSVETLGATNFIASDKTGTLTKNEMTVTRFYANGATFTVEGSGYAPAGDISPVDETDAPDFDQFIQAAILNNEASVHQDEQGHYVPYGNPTDVALTVLGHKAGRNRDSMLNGELEIVRVLPFDSTRKLMSVVIYDGHEYQVLTKGAPDVVLTRTDTVRDHDEVLPIADKEAEIEAKILEFAEQALRTLAVTHRKIDEDLALHGDVAELEQHLNLLGIAGIIDPPRPEVKQSVATLRHAGIATIMITGDHAATAKAIALRLGIIQDSDAEVIDGPTLDQMSDKELRDHVLTTRVYARVSPEHKQRIVQALQSHKAVVAMTGDGINDAPALRAADIGIAMGINGTAVTKDAADLILLDDKFTTITSSVEAGRTIFGNIRNFMRQELITNVAEVLTLLFGAVFLLQDIGNIPSTAPILSALMVLWVNMISDSIPSFALGYDKPEADLMQQPPRDVHQSILKGMVGRIAFRGTVMAAVVFAAFVWAANSGYSLAMAQTVAFLTLVFGQLWHAFDARSNKTIFHRNPFDNGRLLLAVGFAATSSILVTLIPFFNTVMGTAPLPMMMYLAVIFIPAIPTFLISGIKALWLKSKGE